MNTQQKAMLEWQRSEKTAIDVEKFSYDLCYC